MSRLPRGTWVRFQRDGRLVIGQVEYGVRLVSGWMEYLTDVGTVRGDRVLEARLRAVDAGDLVADDAE